MTLESPRPRGPSSRALQFFSESLADSGSIRECYQPHDTSKSPSSSDCPASASTQHEPTTSSSATSRDRTLSQPVESNLTPFRVLVSRMSPADPPTLSTRADTPTGSQQAPDEVVVGRWPLRTKLRRFERPVPLAAQRRLVDIKVLFSSQLCEILCKYSPGRPDASLQLRYLGRSDDDTALFLIIQCDKAAARAVKHFFSQDHVKEQFQSDFGVYVLGRPPKVLARSDGIDVWTGPELHSSFAYPEKTLCGETIFVPYRDRASLATMGGVIMIQTKQGLAPYGMTSGHIFQALRSSSVDDDLSTDSDTPVEDDYDIDMDTDDEPQLELDDFEEGTAQSNTHIPSRLHFTRHLGCHEQEWLCANYDCALIKLERSHWLPNFMDIFRSGNTPQRVELTTGDDLLPGGERNVAVLASKIQIAGTIRNQRSSVMIGSGAEFIETYDLTLAGVQRLLPGHSGSWVVDSNSGSVYGYVVGNNAFGEPYVVPLRPALAALRTQLQCENVFLPPGIDFFEIFGPNDQASRRQRPTSDEGPESLDTMDSPAGQAGSISTNARQTEMTAPTVFSDRSQEHIKAPLNLKALRSESPPSPGNVGSG